MRRFILIILLFLTVGLSLSKAQSDIVYDQFGEPQPFIQNSKYRSIIELDTIKASYEIEALNNDSLLIAFNPPETKNLRILMSIDTNYYSLKQKASKFVLQNGTLWILKVSGPTAKKLTVKLKDFILPKGALFSYYQANGSSPFKGEQGSYLGDGIKKLRNAVGIFGNEIIIEYYEPKSVSSTDDIFSGGILYGFSNGLGLRVKDISKKSTEDPCYRTIVSCGQLTYIPNF